MFDSAMKKLSCCMLIPSIPKIAGKHNVKLDVTGFLTMQNKNKYREKVND